MHKICYTCKVSLEAFIYPITLVAIYYLYLAAKVFICTNLFPLYMSLSTSYIFFIVKKRGMSTSYIYMHECSKIGYEHSTITVASRDTYLDCSK
jgi:hypothetical protein